MHVDQYIYTRGQYFDDLLYKKLKRICYGIPSKVIHLCRFILNESNIFTINKSK